MSADAASSYIEMLKETGQKVPRIKTVGTKTRAPKELSVRALKEQEKLQKVIKRGGTKKMKKAATASVKDIETERRLAKALGKKKAS